jgi:hypothetical protein
MLLKAMVSKRPHIEAAGTELLGLRALALLLP